MRAAVLACVLVTGCRVIVLGDSLTCPASTGCSATDDSWVTRMALPAGWRVENAAHAGMQAADHQNGVRLRDGEPAEAAWHLMRLLATHPAKSCLLVPRELRTRLVIALGTNDILQMTPAALATALVALYDTAHAARPCWVVYVATVPPRIHATEADRAAVNEGIRLGMRLRGVPEQVIEFGDVPAEHMNTDGVHLTFAGWDWRASVAHAALFGS
jgi:lysophospholipase L1-like esterase